jgi:hypothetical protein
MSNANQPAGRNGGKWLTPLQFGRAVHVSRSTVYRRIEEGDIDERLIEYAGPRKILLHKRAVRYFRAFWRRQRETLEKRPNDKLSDRRE